MKTQLYWVGVGVFAFLVLAAQASKEWGVSGVRGDESPVVVMGGVSGVATPPTPLPAIVPGHRIVLQIKDWAGVGGVCADGTPATVDSVYPDGVVFSCLED
jgi:hypothetical protein